MYCPKCASTAVPGQRYCRACGANLGAIWDAVEGKRGQLDFETLKSDLRELGVNLRAGFEQAKENFNKHTNRLNHPPRPPGWAPAQGQVPVSNTTPPEVTRELRRMIKDLRRMIWKVKAANTRKHSLQQGVLA